MVYGNCNIPKPFIAKSNPEKKNTNPKLIGKKTFQPINISWSKRNLGKFARTKIKRNTNIKTLVLKQNNWIKTNIELPPIMCWKGAIKKGNGPKSAPPPKNKHVNKLHINKILEYSPKKKAANVNAEYSTLYPATNSASASAKSKGALFVSAKIEMKKIIAKGNIPKTNQVLSICVNIILFKFKEFANNNVGSTQRLIETS